MVTPTSNHEMQPTTGSLRPVRPLADRRAAHVSHDANLTSRRHAR